jgi:hypothetical protein
VTLRIEKKEGYVQAGGINPNSYVPEWKHGHIRAIECSSHYSSLIYQVGEQKTPPSEDLPRASDVGTLKKAFGPHSVIMIRN